MRIGVSIVFLAGILAFGRLEAQSSGEEIGGAIGLCASALFGVSGLVILSDAIRENSSIGEFQGGGLLMVATAVGIFSVHSIRTNRDRVSRRRLPPPRRQGPQSFQYIGIHPPHIRLALEDLGVTGEFNGEAIKRAFRRLSMQYHPDRNPNDPEAAAKFGTVNDAYNILKTYFEIN